MRPFVLQETWVVFFSQDSNFVQKRLNGCYPSVNRSAKIGCKKSIHSFVLEGTWIVFYFKRLQLCPKVATFWLSACLRGRREGLLGEFAPSFISRDSNFVQKWLDFCCPFVIFAAPLSAGTQRWSCEKSMRSFILQETWIVFSSKDSDFVRKRLDIFRPFVNRSMKIGCKGNARRLLFQETPTLSKSGLIFAVPFSTVTRK